MNETCAGHKDGFERARQLFCREFGEPAAGERLLQVHAPGRSEIAGNHTDHEGGHVIAGALDVAVNALARPNGLGVVRLASDGYPPSRSPSTRLTPRTLRRTPQLRW